MKQRDFIRSHNPGLSGIQNMRRRGFLITSVLILTTIIVEIQLLLVIVFLSFLFIQAGGRLPSELRFIGMDGNPLTPRALNGATLVRDRIYRANGRPVYDADSWAKNRKYTRGKIEIASYTLTRDTDFDGPGSGIESPEMDGNFTWPRSVFGDANHHWVEGDLIPVASGGFQKQLFEVIDGQFIPQAAMPVQEQTPIFFKKPVAKGLPYERCGTTTFVLDGRLSSIQLSPPSDRELYQLVAGKWVSQGRIELLDTTRPWVDSKQGVILDKALDDLATNPTMTATGPGFSKLGILEVLPIGSSAHLFWRLPGRLLYHRGIKFRPSKPSSGDANAAAVEADIEEPVDALEPLNVAGMTDEWMVVTNDLPDGVTWFLGAAGKEPAVIMVDETRIGYPVVRAMRIDNGRWTEFAEMPLRFSACVHHLGSRMDGSSAIFASTGHSGLGGLIELDSSGFHETDFQFKRAPNSWKGYALINFNLRQSIVAGFILALVATLCMWRDAGTYEFGHQTVQLASVMERGIAKAIDIALIALMTTGVGWLLASCWKLDWKTTTEAISIGVYEHPAFAVTYRIAMVCLISFVSLCLLIVATQGRFSVTPGKWICGLRTVQSSLRPCGFAKSLFREIALVIDSLYLSCWAPGILSIAFTDMRQRLGDRLADTIVVRAKSLARNVEP